MANPCTSIASSFRDKGNGRKSLRSPAMTKLTKAHSLAMCRAFSGDAKLLAMIEYHPNDLTVPVMLSSQKHKEEIISYVIALCPPEERRCALTPAYRLVYVGVVYCNDTVYVYTVTKLFHFTCLVSMSLGNL